MIAFLLLVLNYLYKVIHANNIFADIMQTSCLQFDLESQQLCNISHKQQKALFYICLYCILSTSCSCAKIWQSKKFSTIVIMILLILLISFKIFWQKHVTFFDRLYFPDLTLHYFSYFRN